MRGSKSIFMIFLIGLSICLMAFYFHFGTQGEISISSDSIVKKSKNFFYVDLSNKSEFNLFVIPNPRMLIYLNKKRLYDRVQLIGQGLVKPELKEIASLDYVLSEKRIFLLEGYDLYFSHNRINDKAGIKSLKASRAKVLNPFIFFWFPLLMLVYFFIRTFHKIPYSKRKVVLILFLSGISSMIVMKNMQSFVSEDLESSNLVSDFLKPAYNLIHHGAYTRYDISDYAPKDNNQKKVMYINYREPLLSFLMVPFIHFDKSYYKSNSYDDYLKNQYKHKRVIIYLQVIIVIIIGIVSGYFVYQMTGSTLFSILTNILVSSSPTLTTAFLGIRDTNLIALCLLWFSVSCYWFFKNKSVFNVINISLAASCLILSRASFLYILPFVYLLLITVDLIRANSKSLKKALWYNIIVLLLVSSIVGSWCLRNYVRTGNPSINTYGYGLANVRLCYNDMTFSEFRQAFMAWAPEMTDARWKEIDGPESRFHRDSENSFRKCQLRSESCDLAHAISSVLENPLRHAMITIPVFYKGMFPESWRGNKSRPFFYRCLLSLFFHVGVFLSMIYFSLRSFQALAFSIPTLSYMLFNAFCTHNIQRYNFVVLPILYVCGAIVLFWIFQNLKHLLALCSKNVEEDSTVSFAKSNF